MTKKEELDGILMAYGMSRLDRTYATQDILHLFTDDMKNILLEMNDLYNHDTEGIKLCIECVKRGVHKWHPNTD